MAGVKVEVTIDDREVQAAFAELARRGADQAPAMDRIGSALESSTRLRFRSDQASPDGIPWLPSKRAIRQGGKTLVDTARLVESITYAFSSRSAEIGTGVIYAGIHQFGGQAGRGRKVTLPERPFLGVSDADEVEIVGILRVYLAEVRGVA